jgi:hypothetical protein
LYWQTDHKQHRYDMMKLKIKVNTFNSLFFWWTETFMFSTCQQRAWYGTIQYLSIYHPPSISFAWYFKNLILTYVKNGSHIIIDMYVWVKILYNCNSVIIIKKSPFNLTCSTLWYSAHFALKTANLQTPDKDNGWFILVLSLRQKWSTI